MTSIFKDYYFYLSADLALDFKVYIDHLDTTQLPPGCVTCAEELIVTVRLMDGGVPLTSATRATHTPYKQGTCVYWGEWLALPMKIRDLPKTAQMVIELWGVEMKLIGGTTVRCFDHRLRLKRGLQKLVIWPSVAPFSAGVEMWARSRTHARTRPAGEHADGKAVDVDASAPVKAVRVVDLVRPDNELHLLKLLEAYELNELHRTPWIDRLAFAQLTRELLRARKLEHTAARRRARSSGAAQAASRAGSKLVQESIFLYIHMPAFDYPVIFEDIVYPYLANAGIPPLLPRPLPRMQPASAAGASAARGARPAAAAVDPATLAAVSTADATSAPWFGSSHTPYWYENGSFSMVVDPEEDSENPAETKYHKLARSLMRNVVDTNLKPNSRELSRINEALAVPSLDVRLSADVKDLFWKFRYSLTSNKKALVKFLLCVDWDEEDDAREALSLLPKWALIDTEDALRLLSADFRLRIVREHAVNALRRASDEEVALYLLQLVQALRYEPDLVPVGHGSVAAGSAMGAPAGGDAAVGGSATSGPSASASTTEYGSPLMAFLLERGSNSVELGNYLHWYLTVELEDMSVGSMFSRVHRAFLERLRRTARGREIDAIITQQGTFLQQLAAAISAATSGKGNLPAKVKRLNDSLRPEGNFGELCSLHDPVPMPLHPGILVCGVIPGQCNMFKSALYPTVVALAVHPASRLDWAAKPTTQGLQIHPDAAAAATAALAATSAGGRPSPMQRTASRVRAAAPVETDEPSTPTSSAASSASESAMASVAAAVASATAGGPPPATYRVIFKNGDDMRQDQLIIQMIRLMDQQLKRVGLDLRLTPYRVMATSTSTGIMEMILGSKAVSKVLEEYNNNIMAFFREHHPSPTDEYGIEHETMDTYVKSCAGYCVITYLLGVGDRHLDNIMLTKDGHFLHIDYGYIFGKDPKPMPAPIRITKEMIEGMGGWESSNYRSFKKYCCKAYNILRKSANLVLTLLNLMRDAGIEALADQTDVTLAKLKDKFRLDIQDDEVADQIFLKLVDESVAAFFPALWEVVHKMRVAMR